MVAALEVPGCDGLEFDLRNSADRVPVLLHDADLARVQKVPVPCATLTAEELAEHGIPTFKDVLDAVDCDVFLDVELKERVDAAIDLLELERGRVRDDGTPELRSAVVSSFDPEILSWLSETRPSWPRWLNAYDLSPKTLAVANELGCEAISVEWHAIDADSVRRARDAGLGVAALDGPGRRGLRAPGVARAAGHLRRGGRARRLTRLLVRGSRHADRDRRDSEHDEDRAEPLEGLEPLAREPAAGHAEHRDQVERRRGDRRPDVPQRRDVERVRERVVQEPRGRRADEPGR